MKIAHLAKSHRFGCVCRRCRNYRVGGFLDAFSDKKNTTVNDTRIDNSITDNSITKGASDNATLLEEGATQNVNITDSSPEVMDLAGQIVAANQDLIARVLDSQGNTLTGALGAVAANSAASAANVSSGFNSAMQRFADLKESELTGGDAQRNKIILYVVLGLLAVFAFIFRGRGK